MTKADIVFKEYIRKIMEEGVWSEQARPKYKDGRTANSKYITGAFMEFDLAKGEFPITTLRPIAIKSASKEMLWIYQDQSNSLAGRLDSAMEQWSKSMTLRIRFSNN